MDNSKEISDHDLMRSVSTGDEKAFETLILRYQEAVFGYFRRSGAGIQDTEDLAQETFIKIFRSSANYSPTASFTTFLFTVARNCLIDFLRKKKRRPNYSEFDETIFIVKEGMGAPDEELKRRELEQAVALAMEKLPLKHRETLVLAEGQGLKYQDIAEILDIPVGTVKSRIFSAVKALRYSLSKQGFNQPL